MQLGAGRSDKKGETDGVDGQQPRDADAHPTDDLPPFDARAERTNEGSCNSWEDRTEEPDPFHSPPAKECLSAFFGGLIALHAPCEPRRQAAASESDHDHAGDRSEYGCEVGGKRWLVEQEPDRYRESPDEHSGEIDDEEVGHAGEPSPR